MDPINQLKERILSKKGSNQQSELTDMLNMVREFSCLGEIMGRDFEIKNPDGELVYTIHQKPMAIKQMHTLVKEFITLKKMDADIEAAKWGSKGKGKLGRRGK